MGYILGAEDAYDLAVVLHHQAPDYCFPKGVTNGQTAKIVIKYLNDHPQDLQYSAGSLIVAAFTDAFPCSVEPVKPEPAEPKK